MAPRVPSRSTKASDRGRSDREDESGALAGHLISQGVSHEQGSVRQRRR